MNNFCTQCGTSNKGGNFCIKCGAQLTNNMQQLAYQTPVQQLPINTGRLILNRKDKIMGAAVKIHIKINGVAYELSAGKNITLDLAPGMYQIAYGMWCRSDEMIAINIVPGNQYLIDFVYDPLWGGFKIGKESKLQ